MTIKNPSLLGSYAAMIENNLLFSWLTLVYFKGVVTKRGHSIDIVIPNLCGKLPPHLQLSSFMKFVLLELEMKVTTLMLP